MNIWIVNHYAVPHRRAGLTRDAQFALHLGKCGHTVTIFAASFGHRDYIQEIEDKTIVAKIEDCAFGHFVWIRTTPYSSNGMARIRNMVEFAVRVVPYGMGMSRPDVVVGSTPHPLSALSAYVLSRKFSVPFILDVRDIWPETISEMDRVSSPLMFIMRKLERHLYQSADHIVTPLERAHAHFRQVGATGPITWIPNGVAASCTQGGGLSKPKTSPTFTAMYVGSHGLANNLDVILDAAMLAKTRPECSDIRFILVGGGSDKERLRARASASELPNVLFMDPVPKDHVPAVLESADVCLFCVRSLKVFRYGLSPNKLFEYMAAGKPIIACIDTEDNPVSRAKCGITVQATGYELLNALLELKWDPEYRERLAKAGPTYVRENHNIQLLAERYEAVLRKVLRGAPSSEEPSDVMSAS